MTAAVSFENDEVAGVEIPDPAAWCDSLEGELREKFLISERQARMIRIWHEECVEREAAHEKAEQLGRVVGLLLKTRLSSLPVVVRALALATGLDELNGTHSQAEVARELNVTRALVSHYVCAWADLLNLHVLKFRKGNGTRKIFSEARKKVLQSNN